MWIKRFFNKNLEGKPNEESVIRFRVGSFITNIFTLVIGAATLFGYFMFDYIPNNYIEKEQVVNSSDCISELKINDMSIKQKKSTIGKLNEIIKEKPTVGINRNNIRTEKDRKILRAVKKDILLGQAEILEPIVEGGNLIELIDTIQMRYQLLSKED